MMLSKAGAYSTGHAAAQQVATGVVSQPSRSGGGSSRCRILLRDEQATARGEIMQTRLAAFSSLIVAVLVMAFAARAAAQVAVSDAWVRGTVPGQMGTGAFMRLTSSADTTLVGVASPAAKVVEIHEMKMEGGMM